MATVTLGNSYRFKDYNNNKYLNILVSGNPSNNSNVTIYSLDSSDMAQVWQCVQYSALGVSGALMKSVKDPTFALDNYRGSSNPNNADVYKIGTTAADLKDQLVEFILLTNGYYRIKLAYYDLYLTVTTESTYGGFNVRWQALTGNTNQLWAAELYGSSTITTTAPSSIVDQTFYVKNFNTGYNLNVYGTDTVANERNVNVYSKEKCLAQKWIVRQKSDGAKLFTTINEAYALNINTNTNNCSMYTESSNSSADSVLEFVPYTDATITSADKVYKIKIANHNKYLDVESVGSGANAYWVSSPAYPLWQFVSESDMFPTPKACPTAIKDSTFAIQANGTDFYLNVHGTDTVADGRNVNIYSKDDVLAQRWIPKQTTEGPKLFTKINEGFALNIHTVDNNCTMYTSSGNDEDSVLEFESVGTMQYKIKMFNHNKYLAIDGTADSGSNVVWVDGSANATVWNFIPEATAFPTPNPAPTDLVGKTFFIKNYNTGYNLNVHGTNTVALGRNVNVFAKEPEDSQRWQVVQTPKGPKIITEINSDFALNIHVENNNNCVMYDINENNVDSVIEFVPYDEDNNIYKLKMFHHNKYLEAAGVGSGFNAYWSDSPVYNLWQFVEEDDMFPPVEDAPADIADKVFFIQNVNTGHFLNVHGTDTVANTRNVNVYAKEDANAQRWIIRNKDGGPKLVTKIDETFAVNIYANDNNCTMYKEDGNDIDSVLQFIPYTTGQTATEDDVYRIKMHYHNRYLTVSNTNIGANAWWTSVDSEPYALWKLIPESEMTFDGVTDTDTTPDSSLVSVFMPANSNNYMVGRAGNQISEITIHHTAAVASSVERIGDDWQNPERGASSHYCVRGTRVGQFVKEYNTAYTNGGSLKNPDAGNPNVKAVTIETCNSTGDPTWEVSDDTYYTLVRLVADIARRNNLGTLVVGQNLKTHQDHAYTVCPGPYLLARMQDIADRANEINAAYISGRIYLRKHNTDKFFSVDENSHIILVGKDEARPWVLEKTDDKTYICDFTNPMLKMNVDTDGTTLILTDGDSGVYASFLTEKTFDICYESVTSTFSQRSNSIKKWFSSLGKRLGLFNDEERDSVDSVTDVNEEVDSFTSVVPEFYQSRVVKIKHKETGKYMTYTGKNNILTKGYGNPVELKDMVSDNSDRSQIWKITKFGDDMFCLSSYAAANHSLELYTGNNICVSTNPGMYIPNSRVVSISEVSTGGFTISFPTFDNKYCSQYFEEENATNFICGSSINDSNAVWVFEEPEGVNVNDWIKIYYNPYSKTGNIVSIPDYVMRIPNTVNEADFIEDDENRFVGFIQDSYVDAEGYRCITKVSQNTKKDDYGNTNKVTLTFNEHKNWATIEGLSIVDPNIVNIVANLLNKELESPQHLFKSYTNDKEEIVNIYALYNEIDNENYYWVAVGPKVLYENFPDSKAIYATDPDFPIYDQGIVDAVLSDDIGNNYYLHCLIGDVKAHSWNNGIFQSDFQYEDLENDEGLYKLKNHTFVSSISAGTTDYDYSICIEFMGGASIAGAEKYRIDRLVFYKLRSE
ncbi:MAG: RICIN domain-containing protein [Alphaproteobacteria bacterium]|nr:RICIN domain-containing protein [Alphaproteobacteria bacterium]MBQ6849550.1 RICIN domain-containing protein [Oscillospiraceae bacterium]